jgi:hypothetical protein
MHAHDTRVHVRQLRIGNSELGRQVAAQIVEHGIAAFDELAKNLLTFRVLQIEPETPFIAIECLVKLTIPRSEKQRPHGSPDVATVIEILDLDHLRSEVGEMLRAERAGAVLLDRDDAHSGQW